MTRPEPPYNPGAVARAITHALITTAEADSGGEPANLVDAVFAVARALDHLASAISEANEHADGPHQGGPPNHPHRRLTQ
jgi:hypothetical protein